MLTIAVIGKWLNEPYLGSLPSYSSESRWRFHDIISPTQACSLTATAVASLSSDGPRRGKREHFVIIAPIGTVAVSGKLQ